MNSELDDTDTRFTIPWQLDSAMQSEPPEDRFNKPWSRLDKGSKMNRISQFVKLQKTEHGLNDDEEKRLKIMLTQLCDNGTLNKSGDVSYDMDTKRIETIKHLIYSENDKTYSFRKVPKKAKTTPSKSKSNIERHFNRSLK